MNRFLPQMIACAIIAFFSPVQATPPAGYTQVWADEFNGTALDTTHWTYWPQYAYRDGFITNNAVSVANGKLTITTYTDAGIHYTGFIGTRFKYQPLYGYIEASIRTVNTPGNWSAFWMYIDTVGATLNPHIDGTEPDIMEHRLVDGYNNDISNQIPSTIHWDGYAANHKSVSSGLRGAGLATGYHTYAMEWTPDFQKFYIDGVYQYTVNDNPAADPLPQPNLAPISHRSEFIILSTEIQTNTWAGNIPAAGYGSMAASTTKMDVDYVRVYQNTPIKPIAPTNVTAAQLSTGVQLAWDLIDNAPNYRVKRASVSGGPYTTLVTTGIAATGANYLDTTAVAGTTYYYVVSGVNGPVEGPNSMQVSNSAATVSGSARSGQWAAKGLFSGSNTYAAISQTANVVSNATYEAGVWTKGGGRARLLVYAGSTMIASTFINATPNWTYTSVPVSTGANTQLKFTVNDSSNITGAVSVDDCFLGVSGGANTLANPGFESGAATGWSVSGTGVWTIAIPANNVHSGLSSARGIFSGTPSYAALTQTTTVVANQTYQAGVWIKGTGRARMLVYANAVMIANVFIDATPTWTYYTMPVSTGANTSLKYSINDSSGVAGTIYVDDCFLGVAGGTNMLVDGGLEYGSNSWSIYPTGTSVYNINRY